MAAHTELLIVICLCLIVLCLCLFAYSSRIFYPFHRVVFQQPFRIQMQA